MDISNFTKAGFSFLKAKDVIDATNPILVITTEAILVEKDYKGKKSVKLEISGEMEEKDYKFDLNKTNARKIEETLGGDTKSWIGCQLVLTTYKMMATDGPSKGQLIDAIAVSEVKKII